MNKAIKWVIACALCVWASLSFLVLCGEDTPGQPMSMTVFFVSKGLAVISLYACYRVGKYANAKGYMPEYFNSTDEDDPEML